MKHEILGKISALTASPLNESEVQHLFTLARKLIYKVRLGDRDRFSLLKFYCDWTVHPDIDRSKAGANVLADANNIIAEHLQKKDNATLAADLTAALSLEKARLQFNELIRYSGGGSQLGKSQWRNIVHVMLEIISNCPLTIGSDRRLAKILTAIRARPLRGTSVVEQLVIVKVPSVVFCPGPGEKEFAHCILLSTSDTSRILAPLTWT